MLRFLACLVLAFFASTLSASSQTVQQLLPGKPIWDQTKILHCRSDLGYVCMLDGNCRREPRDAVWDIDFEQGIITYKSGRHYYEGIVGKHMNTIIPDHPRMGILLSSLRVMLFSVQGNEVRAWTISRDGRDDRGSVSELEWSCIAG